MIISRELESVRVVGGQELECRMEIPACARENLLEGVQAGKVEPRLFQQMARLGLFYLEEAFSVCLYQVGVFHMPNPCRYNIFRNGLIDINISRMALSISIFSKSVGISTIDMA